MSGFAPYFPSLNSSQRPTASPTESPAILPRLRFETSPYHDSVEANAFNQQQRVRALAHDRFREAVANGLTPDAALQFAKAEALAAVGRGA